MYRKHGCMEAEDRPCAAGLMIKLTALCSFSELNFEMAVTALWNCVCQPPSFPPTGLKLYTASPPPPPALPVGLKRELTMFHITHACAFCHYVFIISPLRSLWISHFVICKCAHLTNSLFCSVFLLTSEEQRHTVSICLTWPQSSSPTPMKTHQSHWSMVRAVQENGFPPNCTMIICNKVYSISPAILQ